MLFKTTFKDSLNVKRIRKNVPKCNFCLYSSILRQCLIFDIGIIAGVSINQEMCDVFIHCLDLGSSIIEV